PDALQDQLEEMAGRPHTFLPMQAYAEADHPSRLFQYYLLDTHGFQPNVFTARIPGVNDTAMLTATGANGGLPPIGAVRPGADPTGNERVYLGPAEGGRRLVGVQLLAQLAPAPVRGPVHRCDRRRLRGRSEWGAPVVRAGVGDRRDPPQPGGPGR